VSASWDVGDEDYYYLLAVRSVLMDADIIGSLGFMDSTRSRECFSVPVKCGYVEVWVQNGYVMVNDVRMDFSDDRLVDLQLELSDPGVFDKLVTALRFRVSL